MDANQATIPSEFVSFVYLSDPDTEDLIFGDQLADGMIVLAESTTLRHDPDRLATANVYDRLRILEASRWCKIESLRHQSNLVRFIGVYADGSKRVREYAADYAWFVKKNSMPQS